MSDWIVSDSAFVFCRCPSARVKGPWTDPHHGGTYASHSTGLTATASTLEISHKTGKAPHYEDHISFKLNATSGGGCVAGVWCVSLFCVFTEHLWRLRLIDDTHVCMCVHSSSSQVPSMLDAGTNWCNIHDLYCFDGACKPFGKLTYTESISCSSKQTGSKNCY